MSKFLLTVLLSFICCSSCFASAPKPMLNVILLYKCDKAVFSCQNSDEDIIAGRQEFEKTLNDFYKKRFLISEIKYDAVETPEDASVLKAKVKTGQNIFLVKLNLVGQGTAVRTYQNGFGARISGPVPTIKIHLIEGIINQQLNKSMGVDYGVREYAVLGYVLGGQIHLLTDDPRKQTKNAIHDCIQETCTYNSKINKYADPKGLQNENYRFLGEFYNRT